MNNCSMSDVRSLFQMNCSARKHMNDTVLLHIATVFYHNFTPVAANCSARSNINVFANDYISGYVGLRMNKTRSFDYGCEAVECVNRHLFFFKSNKQRL